MKRISRSTLRGSRRAVATVECALLLPFLCFIFIATVDYCRVFHYSITVNNCARNGAIYGCADKTCALDTAGIQAAAKKDVGNLNPALMTVTSSTNDPSNPTLVTVTVTYPFSTITGYPGLPSQTNLSRTIRMSVLPQTPSFN
jgi:Flp pilus assembly protein TadG